MKRYNQPKAGTDHKTVKRDITYSAINGKTRIGNVLESIQYWYKGDINNEWQ